MFLLHKCLTLFIIISAIIISHSNLADADTRKDFLNYDKIEDVQGFLNQFNDKHFAAYLNDVSHYKFEDYQMAIRHLFIEYRNYFIKLNACVSTSSDLEKKYDGRWLDDLLAFAGRDYVKNKIAPIQKLIFNIKNKHYRNFCIEAEKEAVFSEIQYLLTVKELLEMYVSYSETMTAPKQKCISKLKILAETTIKEAGHPPIQTMLYSQRLGTYLNETHGIDLKPDVAEFIINHPAFSRPFNFVNAIQDLRKFEK